MTYSRFILQGLEDEDDHISGLQQVFDLMPLEKGLVASAFMNSNGASLLISVLEFIEKQVDVYIGIRNGITSKQAIEKLMNSGIYPYLVDTASQAYIFHPKVYLASNDEIARLIIGSANLTTGGMAKNIEASLYTELSLDADHDLVQSIYDQFGTLKNNYPDNVFRICLNDIQWLTKEGLLVDETLTKWASTSKVNSSRRTDTRPRMRLNTRKIPSTRVINQNSSIETTIEGTEIQVDAIPNKNLLWKSGPLTERDLNIPTGANTNPTGSMLFKKGDASQDIDQRSFFRQKVFNSQQWTNDPRPNLSHMERCNCKFRFIIKGIDYGVYLLKLSHNSRTDTKTYAQNNSMTQIHWGEAKPLIARKDLLDAICYLYAPDENGVFTLVFDDE